MTNTRYLIYFKQYLLHNYINTTNQYVTFRIMDKETNIKRTYINLSPEKNVSFVHDKSINSISKPI